MAILECGQVRMYAGKDKAAVQKDLDNDTCSTDPTCTDGDKKLKCSKRSLLRPSQEDPKLFLGLVWCACPKELDIQPGIPTEKLKCGTSYYLYGKDKERVERDAAKVLCSLEAECKDDERKRGCSKRSIIGPSREDPHFYLALIWCPCPKELE